MQKRIWITSLSGDKDRVTGLLQLGKKYGLAPDGHFWVDEVEKIAWQAPLASLRAKETGLWVIAGTKTDLEKDTVRYGLSLLCLSLQQDKGVGFPILFVCPDDSIKTEDLPTPFKGCDILGSDHPALGAKLTAKANTPVKPIPMDYRINIHANPGYGIWYEIGPAGGAIWNGVLAGGLKSEVNAHGVGPKGSLPSKTILEYPMQGLKLSLGRDEYTAWAVKNRLDEGLSYYVRFADAPGSILFGPLPDEENEAELHALRMS